MLSLQLCLTLYDSMDRSPPGSSVHGVPQARILEWVATPSSRGSSGLRDGAQCLLHWEAGSLPLAPPGKPSFGSLSSKILLAEDWDDCVHVSCKCCFLQMFSSFIESHYYFPSFCPLNSAHHKIISQISFLLPAENCQIFRGLIHRVEFSKERSGVLLHIRVG